MNINDLIKLVIGGIAYATWKRDKLKRIVVKLKVIKPPDVVVQMKPATARVHAINLQAQSKAVASLTATPRVSRGSPSALEKLLSWYLRIATS